MTLHDGAARSTSAPEFLTGGGEMGALMRAHDWSTSPLGDPTVWPQSLRTAVSLMINSKHPMFIAWGPQLAFLYNDGYAPIFGKKHPHALGLPFREVWSEIWHDIRPLVEHALAGEPTWSENMHLVMERNGFPEDTWYTFSYSPVRDESGEVAGMFCACTETTDAVLAERREQAERERLARMFEQAPGFITILRGPDYIFEFANAAYRRLFGERDYVGRPARELFPELVEQGFFDLLERVYATGERFVADSIPIRLERSPGAAPDERYLDFIYEPLTDESGRVTGIFCEGYDVTEAHRSRQALTASEERLRLATEAAEVGFWDVDTVNDVLIWPPVVKAMFGISADAPVSMEDFYSGLHPEDREHTTAAFVAATDPEKRALYDVEYRTIGKEDGALRWVAAKGRGVFDETGRCVRVIGTAIDITARRLTEAALHESEARVRALTDNLPAGMVYQIRTSADGRERRFLYVSRSHEKLTGVPAAAVLADSTIPYNLIVPEDRDQLVAAEAEAIRTRTPFDVEVRFRRADGEVRWCRLLSAPREQADGSIIWDGIQIDTTDRKSVEAELRDLNETLERRVGEALAERKLLADVFDATGAFIQVVDRDYTLLAINKANADEYERVYGLRPAAGDNLVAVLSDYPEQRDVAQGHFARALAGETFTVTDEFGDPVLGPRWYEIKFSPLRGDDGELIGAYHFSMDVTERRREQERLREAEEALRQAQKMETMGQLTGGVAHDFNNLLTPIVGSLDLLQRRDIGGERERRMIDRALASAERASVLVQRLLAFARRQPLQPTAVDVRNVVEGMAELVRSTTGPQVRVVVDTAPEIPPAIADQNQLEMALLNLSVNARDAMPDGGTLRISAAEEHVGKDQGGTLPPGHYVRLSVADTGTGMDEATLKRAAEPFFSTKGIGKGTGLGLSMVHGLAAQLGGALSISSTPGVGTNVELFLPVAQTSAEAWERKEEAEPAAATGTVLLVDDEDLVRASTADMLTDLGYTVIEVPSAEEALRRLDGGLSPDLLVTDHLMPGMTGTELARELRHRRPGTPVLVVSGYAEVEGVAPDLPRLVKPFRRADLAASLASLGPANG